MISSDSARRGSITITITILHDHRHCSLPCPVPCIHRRCPSQSRSAVDHVVVEAGEDGTIRPSSGAGSCLE